jgi:hypothetical protein
MSEKRGQITIFVVLGVIILLFVSVSFFYIGKRKEVQERTIPTDIADVVSFVEGCMYDLGTNAAFTLGQQGGYLELPQRIDQNPWAYMEILPGIKEPFWYYQGSNLYPPNVKSMEQQINNYINTKLSSCLRNFTLLAARYNIKPSGKIESSTQLTNNDVVIKVKYPLKIEQRGLASTTEFSDFIVHVPARIKKAYELGVKLLHQENRDTFLETQTVNLLVINDEVPFSDLKFNCDQLRWNLDGPGSISESIKETLFWNMPRVRVRNTLHEPFQQPLKNYEKLDKYDLMDIADFENIQIPDNLPSDAYEYKHLYWDIGLDKNTYNDLQVNLNFNREWPLTLKARPSVGRQLVSNHGKGHKRFLNFFCVNSYHYTYDLSFPIEVNIQDSKSFNGEGYNFRYIIPVLIDHNLPNRASTLNVDLPTPDRDPEFCSAEERDYTKHYELRVVNPVTLDKGINANISFECGPFLCDLGKTDVSNLYRLSANLPSRCNPGRITAEAQGYYQGETTVPDNDNRVTVELSPLVTLPMVFFKRNPSDLDKDVPFTDDDSKKEILITLYSEELDFSTELVVNDTHTLPHPLQLPAITTSYDATLWMLKPNALGEKVIVAGYRSENWTVKSNKLLAASKVLFTLYEPDTVAISDAEQIAFYTAINNPLTQQKLIPELR